MAASRRISTWSEQTGSNASATSWPTGTVNDSVHRHCFETWPGKSVLSMGSRSLRLAIALAIGATAPASAQAGKGMRDEYATVNGVKLHYVHAGKGELVLFLHGFPEFWYAWKEQLAAFGTDHLAVAPDLRGYNLSDKPPRLEDYRIDNMVEDV